MILGVFFTIPCARRQAGGGVYGAAGAASVSPTPPRHDAAVDLERRKGSDSGGNAHHTRRQAGGGVDGAGGVPSQTPIPLCHDAAVALQGHVIELFKRLAARAAGPSSFFC